MPQRRIAFTLVELLVVIAIIGVLVALLLPAVQSAREAARRMQCTNHLKQIGLALHLYNDQHQVLPYGCGNYRGVESNGGTWSAFLLPYLEQQSVYDLFDFTLHLKARENAAAVQIVVPTFLCPTDPASSSPVLEGRWINDNPTPALGQWYPGSLGPTHTDSCPFCPNPNPDASNWCCQGWSFGSFPDLGESVGMFYRRAVGIAFSDVTDGLSNTISNGETLPSHSIFNGAYSPNFSVYPTNIPMNLMEEDHGEPVNWYRTSGFKSLHPGGANFLMGDGSVHFFADSADFRTLNAMGTRAGGEASSL